MQRDAPKRQLRCAPDQAARVNEATWLERIVHHAESVPHESEDAMFDGCAPIPDYPPGYDPGPPDLFTCILLVWIVIALLAMLLPRPWFVALFKIAFPFMPDRLEDLDE
jgi:hypothetical protein